MAFAGQSKTWWSFTSSTADLDVLNSEQFLGKTGHRTLFAIEACFAVDITAYSAIETEKEFILPPGSVVEVLGKVELSADCVMIQMRQQEYRCPMLGKK